MRIKLAGLLILLLMACHSMVAQQQDSVLNRKISVRAENLPIATILRNISTAYEIYFSFDASLINTERNTTLTAENQPVAEILNMLFPHNEFRFIQKEDYIIITSLEDLSDYPSDNKEDTDILTLAGKVNDALSGEPLPYVSIAVKKSPIGTITNQEGEFILKLPEVLRNDSVVFSFVGYLPQAKAVKDLNTEVSVQLRSTSVRLREIKVKAVSVEALLDEVRNRISENYPVSNGLQTGFYRETIKQDNEYISVSEAVLEILKAPYFLDFRDDRVRLIKARKSPDVRPFHWVNFKLQGGPYTITKLDAVKTMETFIDKEFQHLYRYNITDVIRYMERPVFVVSFKPVKNISFPLFRGEMYIDRQNYAIVFAQFSLDNYGLDMAGESLIRKKPRGFKVKPLNVDYQVSYAFHNERWNLNSAKAVVVFRVRSREERVNSVFESVSELLVTDIKNTDLKRFPGKELITINDIFTEMTVNYDENFWGNYNIVKPDDDLRNAVKGMIMRESSSVE